MMLNDLKFALRQLLKNPGFTAVAVLTLALAVIGIYSVLSYLVSMRLREIGVRMALGAQQGDVLRLILRTGGKLAAVGIVAGVVASLGTARVVASQMELFQVKTTDPISFLAVVVLLGAAASAACLIPARRATKVDPMEALRYK